MERGVLFPSGAALLHTIMNTVVTSRSTQSPTILTVQPWRLVRLLRSHMMALGIEVHSVNLEGSGATACIARNNTDLRYNDIDLVFHISQGLSSGLHLAREAVFNCFSELLGAFAGEDRLGLASSFFSNIFLLDSPHQSDSWALFTLPGVNSPGIDIKCVHKCTRPYQFSLDSLFVTLESSVLDSLQMASSVEIFSMEIVKIALAGSSFGALDVVRDHLDQKLIVVGTDADVSLIHGGGLLKYATLVSKEYKLAPGLDRSKIERLMCARYYIDFPSYRISPRSGLPVQVHRIHDYLNAHFVKVPSSKTESISSFLQSLHTIVIRSHFNLLFWLDIFLTSQIQNMHYLARQRKHHERLYKSAALAFKSERPKIQSNKHSCVCVIEVNQEKIDCCQKKKISEVEGVVVNPTTASMPQLLPSTSRQTMKSNRRPKRHPMMDGTRCADSDSNIQSLLALQQWPALQ